MDRSHDARPAARRLRRYRTLGLVATLVFLVGCAAPRSRPVLPPLPLADEYATDASPDYAFDEAPAVEHEAAGPSPNDLTRRGSGQLINESAARKPLADAGKSGEVTFNFEGESLHAVVKAILGEFLQQNYVIAPGVQGTVTFSTARPLRGDQALSILEMLLRWNNATLVWQDGRYTVLPIAQALPGNLTPRMGPAQSARGFEVRVVPLRFISAMEMEKLIKPYARPDAVVNVDPQRNMIVLAGTRAELENYLQTIEIFDVDWLAGMSVGVFSLQQAEASKVVAEMEKIFGEGGSTPLSGMFRFLPLEGINGVLVITPQPNYLATIDEWLQRFDLGSGEAGQRLYVYDVKNVKAADLATTLNDIFSGSGGSRSTQRTGAGVAPGLEPVEIRTIGGSGRETPQSQRAAARQQARVDAAARETGVATGGTGAAGVVDARGGISLGATEQVRISAVEESNSLLVRATAAQWESIRRVIERLDQIPLQVVIEAQIVRVALNETLSFGVQWFFENAIDASLRDLAASRRGWTDIAGNIASGAASSGVTWSFIGPNAHAIITALDQASDVTVLSAPSLVVLNNKQASINVGTQIPVTTTSINPSQGTTNTISSVQFRQTGITLSVTPRVNPGGLVFLEISQEESEPGAGDPVGGNIPVDNRSIETEIAVQSGQTVVLGGLIKQTDSGGTSGVPFLSRIPVLGGLFGRTGKQVTREELILMITPRVIRNSEDARRVTEEYQRRFRGLQPLRAPPQGE